MKLLFAPWGNPTGWRELFYEFEGEKVKSSTSLRILQETIEPDKTIIVGLDTLAEEGSNYKEVKESAEKKIKEYVSKFGLKNYDILIAPGIGAFPSGIFHGDALDYYYNIIAKVSLNLLEYSDNTLDIHLDLTHGIN
ncbi:MAG TPA: TIGR01897 family CRISPR-associated protein, partial [Thermococcus sp.]|nr:TIGR01897 family CRISPR-associated protein [Thermococcus sp.]